VRRSNRARLHVGPGSPCDLVADSRTITEVARSKPLPGVALRGNLIPMSPGLPLDHLTVRPATVADAAALGACHNACWRQAYRGLLSPELLAAQDDAARADGWRRALSDSIGQTVVVAEMGDRMVGLAAAGMTIDEQPVRDLELHVLYVLRSVYGTGVGQRLFDAAVGTGRCSLWVAAANARAIGFYRRQGFRPDGAHKRIEEWEGLPIIRMLR